MKNWIKNHKLITGIIILAVMIGLILVVSIITNKNQPVEKQETTKIEKRTLTEKISASGNFVACESTDIKGETTGYKISKINVSVGDTVSVGQVIAVLDTKDLDEEYNSANKNLTDAKEQTQRSKDEALRALQEAEKNRDESLKQVDTSINDAYVDWQDSKLEYENKVRQLNELNNSLAAIDMENDNYGAMYAQKCNLENDVKTYQTIMTRNERTYQEKLANRQSDIDIIWNNYNTQKDRLDTQIENADQNIDMPQDRVETISKQIQNATITSPVAGLVTSVNYQQGEDYNGGSICVVQNVSAFEVVTEIDEYDINKIAVGQEVEIKTNVSDQLLKGSVVEISPIATGSQNNNSAAIPGLNLDLGSVMSEGSMSSSGSKDVTYTVRISVNTPCDYLKIGMSAKLNIIIEKRDNVLSVPYNSVLETEENFPYLQVITGKNEDGTYKTKKVEFQKGVESDYYIEVIHNQLKEGTKIIIPKAEGNSSLEIMLNEAGATGGM